MVYAGAGASMPFIYTDNHYLMNSMYRKNNIAIDTVFANRHLGAANRVFSKAGYNFPYSHNRRKSLDAISGGDFDLFHPTYYDPYFLGHIGDKPFVITVHDMIHEIYPEHFPPGEPVSEWKRKVIPKAAMVIAIGRCHQGIEFEALDHQPVSLIFMIAASDRQTKEFVRLLAKVTHLLKDYDIRQALLSAAIPGDFIHLICANER
jgi:hypothetical protein